jgi:hypothetical protein
MWQEISRNHHDRSHVTKKPENWLPPQPTKDLETGILESKRATRREPVTHKYATNTLKKKRKENKEHTDLQCKGTDLRYENGKWPRVD